ncbi:type VI secretion system-associated FHA domain protein TagH [Bradyrhizobium liaoningense]|uniref:type VI secretion system-associated FHA domain protein TagH n=1 Tax=Bradyrhizobium liaoningense TaxID=43992 RepID=UPI001BAC2ADA|nr:type VI secretion system-associated FHA domain protein TagH [Bradyrhizobium liaoningense]MBR0843376.1 type VI secretion system-associated FHA domain protein TagH [Bradyrhizobium liaoningense]MBR0856885.1 type VI secretion system-associated FHA domain protein TagH [Bradyrhizobium liaoningense]
MVLRFHIENESNLPDGGPVSFSVSGRRSIDIGRDRHLDWTLPDPARMISGKHCEVHFRDGGYWLHDVSTNGTFLNGADQRMRGPHRLRDGDRLTIGHYIIGVSLEDEAGGAALNHEAQLHAPPLRQHANYQELWAADRDVPPPIDPQHLKTPREAARPVNPEFLDWAASIPAPGVDPARRSSAMPPYQPSAQDDMSWAAGPVVAPKPPVERPPAMPTPRRPSVWTDDEPAPAQPLSPSRAEPRPAQTADERPVTAMPVGGTEFARLVARAAGLPDNFFANQTDAELAEQLGIILRVTVDNLMALLQARTQAKQLARSTSQTTVQAIENNPLKFSPTSEEAMRILFGPPTRSYLDARRAFAQGFGDLKSHQLKTYMAMQHAVHELIAGIDPTLMARELELQRGASSWLGTNKSKLWDEFLTRWKAHLGRDSSAPIDTFMLHFSNYYDRADKAGSK